MEQTIDSLAKLPFNYLLAALPQDDMRWIEIAKLSEGFSLWLRNNGVQESPQNAMQYLSSKENEIMGKEEMNSLAEENRMAGNALYRLGFYALLDKRMKQYKDNPYNGELGIGHFLGIIRNEQTVPAEIIGFTSINGETIYQVKTSDNITQTVKDKDTRRIY